MIPGFFCVTKKGCHCEEPTGDVAISWYRVRIPTLSQEIATG